MKKAITEGSGDHKEWYGQAKAQTLESLPSFLRHLMEDFGHDYGTICHALAAGAVAAASAMNHHPGGGITGFQAGAVMWEFIRGWNLSSNKTGLKLVDYDNFLYPQYSYRHQKTISPSTWEAIQKEAKRMIDEADIDYSKYLIEKEKYEKDLAAFIVKYPDYPERKEHYDRLGMGTGDEWDAFHEKEKSGFEFAPSKPFAPITKGSPVYSHWEDIIAGSIPFGYQIENK